MMYKVISNGLRISFNPHSSLAYQLTCYGPPFSDEEIDVKSLITRVANTRPL